MKPVLKYPGGKAREIKHFIEHIPSGYDRYIEPFLGGGALYFYLEPGNAVLNDVNPRLMGFYSQLRNDYPLMRTQLDFLQALYEANQADYMERKKSLQDIKVPNANEELYYRMRELFNNPDGSLLDGVVYFFINKTAYSGMIRYNRNGEYNVPFGHYKNMNTRLITQEHSDVLQGAELLNLDYRDVFDMTKDGDFVFLDPPYDCVFKNYGTDVADEFGEEEHRRLAEDFKNLSCRALMVVGKTTLTEGLYEGYVCDEYQKDYSVNIRNRFKSQSKHLIIKNY